MARARLSGRGVKLSDLKTSGHLPTLVTAFLYFDISFMVWTLLGPLGAQIGDELNLSAGQKGLMVAMPILSAAFLRIGFGMLVDRIGAKLSGIITQLIFIAGLFVGWRFGVSNFSAALALGTVLGAAGASFAVALPQAGRWYPPQMQGLVMGLVGAGYVTTVTSYLLAPRFAAIHGWQSIFGCALIPALVLLIIYAIIAKDAPVEVKKKTLSDYWRLLREKDAHWFCFYYTVSFGGIVGLISSYVLYFKSEFALSAAQAGTLGAICTAAGALGRPIGGGLSDRIGGIRLLLTLYTIAATGLIAASFTNNLWGNFAMFVGISFTLGMANGSVFQLLPQRFGKDLGVMTGLVGCGGGLGGFLLANMMGQAKQHTGSYAPGFLVFAALCVLATTGLALVKTRWRTTWGATVQARI